MVICQEMEELRWKPIYLPWEIKNQTKRPLLFPKCFNLKEDSLINWKSPPPYSHRADGGLLVAELLFVSLHHVFDFQLLHDLLLLQIGVLLLSDGASQLLGVRLRQTGFQLRCQRFSAEGKATVNLLLFLVKWMELEKSLYHRHCCCYCANQKQTTSRADIHILMSFMEINGQKTFFKLGIHWISVYLAACSDHGLQCIWDCS